MSASLLQYRISRGGGSWGMSLAERRGGPVITCVEASSDAHRQGVRAGLLLAELELTCGATHDLRGMRLRTLVPLLQHTEHVTLRCEPASEAALAPVAPCVHDTPVLEVRALLDAEEVALVHEVARESAQDPARCLGHESRAHTTLSLHAGGFFARRCPQLLDALVDRMRSRWPEKLGTLGVRCVEFHTYRVGGGLLDADHRDVGSTLTLSVLLSPDAAALRGGQFVTWAADERTVHRLGCGDGVLFHSERAHNVQAVEAGVRHSLVVELWGGGDNQRDRHR